MSSDFEPMIYYNMYINDFKWSREYNLLFCNEKIDFINYDEKNKFTIIKTKTIKPIPQVDSLP